MASLHVLKFLSFARLPPEPSDFRAKSDSRTRIVAFGSCGGGSRWRCFEKRRKLGVCCATQEGEDQSNNNEEAPESLFMKELKRRGMNLLEDTNKSNYGQLDEMKLEEEGRGSSNRNAVSTEVDKNLANQRERSMALNSEGLEGLVPRAKLLLSLGGTFFLGFVPLILVTVGVFSALYFYFGSSFVHDASDKPVSLQYVDPYELLEDERISQMAPSLK